MEERFHGERDADDPPGAEGVVLRLAGQEGRAGQVRRLPLRAHAEIRLGQAVQRLLAREAAGNLRGSRTADPGSLSFMVGKSTYCARHICLLHHFI